MEKNQSHSQLISIIIPHYNQPEYLDCCLQALLHQTVEKGLYVIYVVDNASDCDIEWLRRKYKYDVKFLVEEKKGAAHARNCALQYAKTAYIFFTDADCTPHPDWVAHHLDCLQHSAMSGGRIDVSVENSERLTASEIYESIFGFRQKKYIEEKGFSATANLAVKREVAECVGEFRDGLSEDVDWCWRARQYGFNIAYNDKAVITHPARSKLRGMLKKFRRISEEDTALRLEWGQSFLHIFTYQIALIASPFVDMFKISSYRCISIKQKLSGISMLYLIRFYRAAHGMSVLFKRLATQAKRGRQG